MNPLCKPCPPAEPYLMPKPLALLALLACSAWVLLWLVVGLLLLSALGMLAWLIFF